MCQYVHYILWQVMGQNVLLAVASSLDSGRKFTAAVKRLELRRVADVIV